MPRLDRLAQISRSTLLALPVRVNAPRWKAAAFGVAR